jgi:Circularly permutated YpsA SLOG family
MIKAISGGQTGADLAALDAALACGFQTGGCMPWGFSNEDGRHAQSWAKRYGFVMMANRPGPDDWKQNYRDRTESNVQKSDVTIWFEWSDNPKSPGYWCTLNACKKSNRGMIVFCKPYFDVNPIIETDNLAYSVNSFETINFAGNRESKAPGIYDWVYGLLFDVFQELKAK